MNGEWPDGAPIDCDVAVVGGGPAGSGAAIRLADKGLRVVIVEPSCFGTVRVGETLPPHSQASLTQLGLWSDFMTRNPLPSYGMSVEWGDAGRRKESLLFNPYGAGWHVNRAGFDCWLVECAKSRGVQVLLGWRAVGVERQSDERGWQLHIERKSAMSGLAPAVRTVSCSFVVDASGRRSQVARWQGARRQTHDRLVAVAGYWSTPDRPGSPAQKPLALQAMRDGWCYAAPLPGGGLVVALLTDADVCARGRLHDRQPWQALLDCSRVLAQYTQGRRLCRNLIAVPASSSRLDRVAGDGWVAVGDAAEAWDPLSGTGIARALASAIHASDGVVAWLAGDAGALEAYASAVEESFQDYLRTREIYYTMEGRWPTAPFWHRRRAA